MFLRRSKSMVLFAVHVLQLINIGIFFTSVALLIYSAVSSFILDTDDLS